MRMYATMRKNRPDFFHPTRRHHLADVPISAEVKLPDGTLWKNLVTEEKSKRGLARGVSRQLQIQPHGQESLGLQHRDSDVRAVGRPRGHQQLVPGEDLTGAKHRRLRYQIKMRWGSRRAPIAPFTEYCRSARRRAKPAGLSHKISYGPLLDVFMLDMRSYRGPNGEGARKPMVRPPIFLARSRWLAQTRTQRFTRAVWR